MKIEKDFIFGTATSAYQIEGAYNLDGKTDSIWDDFCEQKGKIKGGDDGKIACDHYHKYEQDIEIMKEMGIQSYRLSIAWARIFPKEGEYNPKGMEFYKKILAKLKEANIEPIITLYHWDLPMWAYKKGGWLNREVINDFVDYSKKVFEELNGEVEKWITHNEPFVVSMLGYSSGEHAPGHKNMQEALEVAHNLLISHGKVIKELRKIKPDVKIGITLNLSQSYPEKNTKNDRKAARFFDGMLNRWFLEPIFKGKYPEDMIKLYKEKSGMDFSFIKESDFEDTAVKIDFFGINYYNRSTMKYSKSNELEFESGKSDFKRTEMGWEVDPNGLYDLIVRIRKDYTKLPIMITENGAAYPDEVNENGEVIDDERTDYIVGHLEKITKLNQEGYNISAYYLWSFLDNFEWAHGYSKRFGIVYVDFGTQKRTVKKSGKTYADIIQKNEI